MAKMIAITVSPGATTAAGRPICPLACSRPPPAAASTSRNVPSTSAKSRRYANRGSQNSANDPNPSASR